MKKVNKKELIKEIKKFLKVYLFSLASTAITLLIIDSYAYKDNIYYHNELKLNQKEIEEIENTVSEAVGEEITINDNSIVLDAALENDNLTEEEKLTIYRFTNLLDDNPYLDKTNAYNKLRKLDIKYEKDADYGEDVLGVYINSDNEITIIQDNEKQETILHEIIHCIYSHNYYHKLPRFFNEGMTELLTNEYFEENPFKETKSYSYEVIMVKMLCEIVGEDKVLESYSTGDITILEEALREETQISEPKELLERMDSVTTNLQNKEDIDKEEVKDIIGFLDNYYIGKYDVDSIEFGIYTYNRNMLEGLYDKNPNATYIYNLVEKGYYIKAYFSSELKEKYQEIKHVNYSQDISGKIDEKYLIKTIKYNDSDSI